MLFDRCLLGKLKKWADRREIFAIKGPRQSGKTTLLHMFREWLIKEKKVKPERIVFVSFEDREELEKFDTGPKDFIESFLVDNKRHYFLLDEFHYVQEGGQKLKFLFDSFENIKFVITGSSSLELASKTAKHLVGRMFSFHLYPFSFEEFLKAKNKRLARVYRKKNRAVNGFILEDGVFEVKEDIFLSEFQKLFNEFTRFGAYPEVIKAKDIETKKTIIKNIYETYISKEIIELLKIHDLFKFKKIVSILGAQLGGMTNYNELSSTCDSYYKEIIETLEILEETYIIKSIRPFHKNLKTELKKNPKTYFIDLGLRNYAINNFNSLENRVDKGEIAENFVLGQLLKKEMGKPNYWRTLGKAEVDFVLSVGNEIIPIEVKYKKFNKPRVSKSFKSFISAYKPKKAIVLTKNFWEKTKIGKTTIAFIPIYYM